ncbi:hypothetical protein WMY93_018526 [Mugilogobius chulae]|uniref:Secreted protein n=1 Tax=Mugilogobius chulae TaxID=88201 RepID=A0AAW0NUG5_9GOBI
MAVLRLTHSANPPAHLVMHRSACFCLSVCLCTHRHGSIRPPAIIPIQYTAAYLTSPKTETTEAQDRDKTETTEGQDRDKTEITEGQDRDKTKTKTTESQD